MKARSRAMMPRISSGALALGLLLGGPSTGAQAYERDVVDAANAARVSLADMQDLVVCLERARDQHPEWTSKSRADLVQLARGIQAARTLGGQTGPEGQRGAMATCRLLRDLP